MRRFRSKTKRWSKDTMLSTCTCHDSTDEHMGKHMWWTQLRNIRVRIGWVARGGTKDRCDRLELESSSGALRVRMLARACERASVRVCERACVRACVRACARAC
eukprot:9643890-Alexandrium_andersonii.AAC.1